MVTLFSSFDTTLSLGLDLTGDPAYELCFLMR